MKRENLINHIFRKKSCLCVGLDPDFGKVPECVLSEEDPIFAFNKAIIDATAPYCVAYKPNSAFYECHGVKGWEAMVKTISYIKTNYPEHFVIADAKRGDIGNTSKMYAKTFFDNLGADAITVAPYLGLDSVSPFLEYKDKWTILLALTSNAGSNDFQMIKDQSGLELFKQVISKSMEWGNPANMMYVVGATKTEYLQEIRKIAPESFLLVPGVGAQGGSLQEVMTYGKNKDCGLLINSSRGIIYASRDTDFAEAAATEAARLASEMSAYLG